VGGAVAVALTTQLPWATTGGATRSGWALAGTVHRLDLAGTTVLRAALIGFLLAPVLAAGAWVAAFTGRPVWVCTLGAVNGLVAEAAWVALRASTLESEAGAHLAGVSGGVALAGAAVLGCQLGARKQRSSP
jgi:hypothetical protein